MDQDITGEKQTAFFIEDIPAGLEEPSPVKDIQ
jgi:hypothetical protein